MYAVQLMAPIDSAITQHVSQGEKPLQENLNILHCEPRKNTKMFSVIPCAKPDRF